jgi:glutaminyl-tRNA synthetase
MYDKLFTDPTPASHDNKDVFDFINPNSLKLILTARIEPSLANAKIGEHYQFLRKGYFTVDINSKEGKPIFNFTVSLKESYKIN